MKTALRMIAAGTVLAFCSATQAAEDPAADIAALKKLAAGHTLIKDGDKGAGAAGYAMCLACHGPTGAGNPALQSPRITGLPAWYLAESVKKFKAGMRGADPADVFGAQMKMMATVAPATATDKGLADLTAHIAGLAHQADAATIKGNADKGKALYAATCTQCHGEKGEGNVALLVPPLNTQPDWYVKNQLVKFRNGQRGAHANDKTGAIMTKYAKALADDQAINDLATHIAKLAAAKK
jgi:cytochrome c oxidase subunit 2